MRGTRRSALACRWFGSWRNQRGEAILGIIVLAASLAAILGAYVGFANVLDRERIGGDDIVLRRL